MKYMLLIYDNEQAWGKLSEADQKQIYGEYMQFTQEIESSGHYLASSQLHPTGPTARLRRRTSSSVAIT